MTPQAKLEAMGYAVRIREQGGFFECLLSCEDDTTVGIGATAEQAALDALRRLLPTRAARTGFAVWSAPERDRDRDREPGDGDFHGGEGSAHRPIVTEVGSTLRVATFDGGFRGAPARPPEPTLTIDEASMLLTAIRQDMEDGQVDLALLAPIPMRLQMTSWISRARAIQNDAPDSPAIDHAVRGIAQTLSQFGKTFWPGSVSVLQLHSRPADASTFVPGYRTRHRLDTWRDAAEYADVALEYCIIDPRVDRYGWVESKVARANMDHALDESVTLLERLTGTLAMFPNDLDPAVALESIDELVTTARRLRWIRRATRRPILWARALGRMRWISTVVVPANEELKRALDPQREPLPEWIGTVAESPKQADKLRVQRDLIAKAPGPAKAEKADLVAWLAQAFDVFTNPQIAKILHEVRDRVLALDPDALSSEGRTARSRLQKLRPYLERSAEEIQRTKLPEPDGDQTESASEASDPQAEIVDLVHHAVDGKRALLVGPREEPDVKHRLEEDLGLHVTWCDEPIARVRPHLEATPGFDVLVAVSGFMSHQTSVAMQRTAKEARIPFVRASRGRPLSCVVALARELGLRVDDQD